MDLVPFDLDLYPNELERVATTLAVAGDTMDLVTMHANEADAHRLLYSGLDRHQRSIYRRLVAHGVLEPHA